MGMSNLRDRTSTYGTPLDISDTTYQVAGVITPGVSWDITWCVVLAGMSAYVVWKYGGAVVARFEGEM